MISALAGTIASATTLPTQRDPTFNQILNGTMKDKKKEKREKRNPTPVNSSKLHTPY
jgi:hypothetical protein